MSTGLRTVSLFTFVCIVTGSLAGVPSLRPAPRLQFPHQTDSNSPLHWDGQYLYIFNSAVHPWRSYGSNLLSLANPASVTFNNTVNGGRWIEATWKASDGTLYGWYHNEPAGLCPGTTLTAPRIGAARSQDNGATWTDLGIILQARSGTLKCDAKNGYFAGGHGDFCVMLDAAQQYLYIFFSTYAGGVAEQGVAVARMGWADRDAPYGKAWKYYNGNWQAPGLGGNVTPFLPATTAWERIDCDAFWGPSVHWNSSLQQYVMLLNRAKGTNWVQEGIYVSYASDLANPSSWSAPEKFYDGGAWYPQVVGLAPGMGTDKAAGGVARFFMSGISDYEISFQDLLTNRGTLNIARSDNRVVLSWATNLANASLESSTDLNPGSWTKVNTATGVSNGTFVVTNDVSGLSGSTFFRLRQ